MKKKTWRRIKTKDRVLDVYIPERKKSIKVVRGGLEIVRGS